jgi:hypothetical protein
LTGLATAQIIRGDVALATRQIPPRHPPTSASLNDEVRAQLHTVNQRLHDIEQDVEAVKRVLRRAGLDE